MLNTLRNGLLFPVLTKIWIRNIFQCIFTSAHPEVCAPMSQPHSISNAEMHKKCLKVKDYVVDLKTHNGLFLHYKLDRPL